jgi:hypothetical protein
MTRGVAGIGYGYDILRFHSRPRMRCGTGWSPARWKLCKIDRCLQLTKGCYGEIKGNLLEELDESALDMAVSAVVYQNDAEELCNTSSWC